MKGVRLCIALVASLSLAMVGLAQDPQPTLLTAHGAIDKIDKESLTVRPRGADGKFEKTLVLKLTGTSKISTLTYQKRAGKTVAVQKETEAKELMPKQTVAVIYTMGADGLVLLTAVALPDK